jgi:glycosyltransferase involved in cell wall biosynthesis
VIPEVTGLLVPTGSPEAVCEAVLKLLRNPDQCRSMSVAARAWVAANYDDGSVLGLAVAFYMNLIRPIATQNSRIDGLQSLPASGLPASQ